ncbi:hypothetical protein DFQ28_011593 [Apophysomyces sp. BC1034]|nr:hypothetical protein DFQ28_011593 [Apophysomyces sp. BC1034]
MLRSNATARSPAPAVKNQPRNYIETHEPRLRALESALSAIELKSADADNLSPLLGNDPNPSRPKPVLQTNIHSTRPPYLNKAEQVDSISVSTIGQGHYMRDWLARTDRIPLVGDLLELDPEPDRPAIKNDKAPIQMDLIQAYFNHIHPYLPILHCPKFHEQLRQKPCPLLLNALYAVASRWHPSQAISSENPPGWRYYDAAMGLLDIYTDAPRLSTVQALLLLVKYNEHTRRPGFFWRTRFYFQIIVRMSKDLGLPREIPQGSQVNLADIEERKRVFWAVYAYDIFMSTEQGTQPNFNVNDCILDYPNLLQDETQKDDQELLLYFHWLAKIVRVHARVLSFMRQKYIQKLDGSKKEEQHVLQDLQTSLDELRSHVTNFIKLPRNIGKNKKRYLTCFLHMALHFVTILLHRPYAFQNPGHGNDLALHQQRCSMAALAITRIAEVLVKEDGTECLYYSIRGVQQVVHYLSAAVTIYRARNGPNASISAKEMCEKSLAIIQQLVEKSPATELDSSFKESSLSLPPARVKTEVSDVSSYGSDRSSSPLASVKQSPPKTTKPRRMSAKSATGSTRSNLSQRKTSAARPLSWDVNSNVSPSYFMQSSAAITDPEGMHHLGYLTQPHTPTLRTAVGHSPYPYYPLSVPMLGLGPTRQPSTNFSIPNYTQTQFPAAGFYPSPFDAAEMMDPYHMVTPSTVYPNPVYSSDMYAHTLPSTQIPSGVHMQQNPYITTMTPLSPSHRRHTVSGTCQQPNPALFQETHAFAARNGVPQPLTPNMNVSPSYMGPTMLDNNNCQMMVDESFLTEPPPSDMQAQSMMSLLTGQDSAWDYSTRSQGS